MEELQKKFKSILTNPEITLEYIYNGDLTFDAIRDNPILKPISEINKNYCDLHITATKSILEFEDEYKKIQELEIINPRYTNTVLMATIKNIITSLKIVVHSQDLCDIGMKSVINEMIGISGSKYKLMDDDSERIAKIRTDMRKEMEKEYKEKFEKPIENISEVPKRSKEEEQEIERDGEYEQTISDLKKIAGEGEPEKKEVIPDKPKKVYSTLLEREI